MEGDTERRLARVEDRFDQVLVVAQRVTDLEGQLNRRLGDLREALNDLRTELREEEASLESARKDQAETNDRLNKRIDTLIKTIAMTGVSIFIAVVTFVVEQQLGP